MKHVVIRIIHDIPYTRLSHTFFFVDRDVLLSPSAPNTATARRPYSALQTYIVINKIWELSEVHELV